MLKQEITKKINNFKEIYDRFPFAVVLGVEEYCALVIELKRHGADHLTRFSPSEDIVYMGVPLLISEQAGIEAVGGGQTYIKMVTNKIKPKLVTGI